jgi:DNA-binding NarL/FixJ family response regulator
MQRAGSLHASEHAPFGAGATLRQSSRRILLFVGPRGNVSEALAAAIEREFDWISVRQVADPQIACEALDADVQLILVDRGLLDAYEQQMHRLASVHPRATTAIVTGTPADCPPGLIHLIEAQTIRGIVPMDVNLDIWLAIIRIMLKGGQYYPPALFRQLQAVRPAERRGDAVQGASSAAQSYEAGEFMDHLTERELEVLTMVARGQQNKVIASDLGLSEHTIKIHLHNIIRKLGVHNRTEAALKYLEHLGHREDSANDAAGNNAAKGRG